MQNDLKGNSQKSAKIFEKVSIKPVLFISSLAAIFFYIITFFPYYFVSKFIIISSFPFLLNYILFYLFILLIFMVIFIFIYRDKIANMEDFSHSIKIFGINPELLVRRTGVRFIDIFGLIISVIFMITSLLIISLHFLVPFFLLTGLSFFFAIISGKTKLWSLKRS